MALRADVVVFSLGALLFGAGAYGMWTSEPHESTGAGIAGASVFSVTWSEASRSVDRGSRNVGEAASADHTFELAERGLSRIVAVFDCQDNHPLATSQNAAVLTVALTGPGNLTGDATGRCDGPIEVPVAIQPAPTATAASGATQDEARASLLAERDTSAGVGEWTARLSLTRPVTIPQGVTGAVGGGSVTLTVTLVNHEPNLVAQPR